MNVHSSKIFMFILVIASSCELIVDVDVPYDGDKVVVNAIQQPDSVWYVDLTLTKNIVGNVDMPYLYVTDANVVISLPDGSNETLDHVGQGRYRGMGHPEPNKTYHVNVDHRIYESVQAQMTMPGVVPIVDVVWDSSQVNPNDPYYFTNVPFTVTFQDPPGIKNYYAVQVVSTVAYEYWFDENTVQRDTVTLIRQVNIQDDPAIATEDDYKLYFPDRSFDGRTYTGHFTNQFYISENEKLLEVKVLLLSMSEENFNYQETKRQQDEVMGDPFAQPVQVYSNMSNGFGIFAGNSVDARVWKR